MSRRLDTQDGTGVVFRVPGRGILLAYGTTVPDDGKTGFAPGCLFMKVNGTIGAVLYHNNGSKTSADFDVVGSVISAGAAMTAQLTTITHTAPGTPDYAIQDLVGDNTVGFGTVTKDEGNSVLKVIANLQVRMLEVENLLEAAGIATAN